MNTIWKKLRHAARSLLKNPGFTAVTVLTLGVGIGANTAIFSVVDGVLLESLPYPEPDRLVSITHSAPGMNLPLLPSATGIHLIDRGESRTFQELALYSTTAVNLTGEGPPERIQLGRATPSLFRVLRVDAALGRTFTEEEGLPSEDLIAILSHRLWTERFSSDPDVVGKTVRINDRPFRIIGVMPEGFAFPSPDVRAWIPVRIDPAQNFFGGFNFPAIGRLKEGVDPADAQRDLTRLLPRIPERFQGITQEMLDNTGLTVNVTPYIDTVVGDVRTALWILLGTVGFVLLIACANVANLLLVRAESRQKEVAIRTAMGAGRGHLLGQFMAESGLLAGAGLLLGLLLAHEGLNALLAFGPESLPRIQQIDLDGSVLAFAGVVTLAAATVFGLIPVLRHRSSRTAAVLRDGYRGSTAGRGGHRARKLLVVSQVAFALILLVGSGLMIRSFRRLQHVDPGFSQGSVLTFRLSLPSATYDEPTKVSGFHYSLLDQLRSLPGVEAAGAVSYLPLSGFQSMDPLVVEGKSQDPNTVPPVVASRAATPGFFEVMGIPLDRGRPLERADAESALPVALLSRNAVHTFFEDQDPLQRQVAQGLVAGHDAWSRVVGIVGDVHWQSLTEPPMPTIYYPIRQAEGINKGWLVQSMDYVVKTSVLPTSIVPAVRRTVAGLDPNLPLARIRTLEQVSKDARAQMEFTMLLLAIAAGVGLLLGSVGLYGVISYVTTQRTREIGVRIALGAEARAVRAMVMRQGLAVTGAGVLVGLLGAWGLSRFMRSMLYQVSATDPMTFAAVATILLVVAATATWIPAMRAAATDPVRALRWD